MYIKNVRKNWPFTNTVPDAREWIFHTCRTSTLKKYSCVLLHNTTKMIFINKVIYTINETNVLSFPSSYVSFSVYHFANLRSFLIGNVYSTNLRCHLEGPGCQHKPCKNNLWSLPNIDDLSLITSDTKRRTRHSRSSDYHHLAYRRLDISTPHSRLRPWNGAKATRINVNAFYSEQWMKRTIDSLSIFYAILITFKSLIIGKPD